ncbi:MAG: metallophosphoesterase [Pseudomonadota bacterium]
MGEHFDKALIFTDLHIVPEGETIIGLDPAERFAEGLAHALARHPDAQHLILLGDLVHTGRQAEYDRLAPLLADCPIPVSVTMGNHDHRERLAATFPGALDRNGFVQRALDLGPLRLLILDTFDYEDRAPLEHDGWLCATRLAWLDAELARAAADGKSVVVMCHHPPCPVGFWAMDAIGLANAHDLLDRLHAAPHVRHLICGHIHHACMREIADIQYINTGDWVESCTAVIEDADGELRLVDWEARHNRQRMLERRTRRRSREASKKQRELQ